MPVQKALYLLRQKIIVCKYEAQNRLIGNDPQDIFEI
jgi:hypothetical protein